MRSLAPGTSLVDVRFQGHPEYIACYVLEAGPELVLVDPGPTSTLGALDEGLRLGGLSLDAVTALLVTHIHLDHSGAAGTLVARNPALKVHVHARGAPHMIDPGKLLASATRLYGDKMEALWGEVRSIPKANVVALEGGETLRLGSRELLVAYTPGHAVHHVSYFEEATGIAWVGDTLGIRIDNRPFVLPVTPPPDVDLQAWADSIETFRSWHPNMLCPTHFGPARPADAHIDEFEQRLAAWAERVEADLAAGGEPDRLAGRFQAGVRDELAERLAADEVGAFLVGGGVRDSWHGLARYFRKRAEREGGAT